MNTAQRNGRAALAVHESAHALVAGELGIRTRNIRITSTAGATEVENDVASTKPYEFCLVLIAGITATVLWLRREHGQSPNQAVALANAGGCDDAAEFRKLAQTCGLTVAAARREVTPILVRHYDRLVRGARVLERVGSMKASEV